VSIPIPFVVLEIWVFLRLVTFGNPGYVRGTCGDAQRALGVRPGVRCLEVGVVNPAAKSGVSAAPTRLATELCLFSGRIAPCARVGLSPSGWFGRRY
jgi:hypothetical protein